MQYDKINKGAISGSAPPTSIAIDTNAPALYIAGADNQYHQVGTSLPVASGAGQVPTSTGAGTTYTAQSPAGGALTLIQKQTLASPAASVTFSAIPGTYTHLRLMITAAGSSTKQNLNLTFNGDTGANYNTGTIAMVNLGALAATGVIGSAAMSLGQVTGTGEGATYPSTTVADIFNYVSTAFVKQLLSQNGWFSSSETNQFYQITQGQWNNTAAITSIALAPAAGNFLTGSLFSLYGVS